MIRLLRSEAGIALPVVMASLAIVSILSGVVATSAWNLSGTSNKDKSSKQALAAAEAGLQAARYRIALRGQDPAKCVTNGPAALDANNECPGYSESLGNGGRYEYWATPVLGPASACAGPYLPGETQRCITSLGTANGVERRLQARVASKPAGPPILPIRGITGLRGMAIGNNALIGGDLGSNGPISIGNNGTLESAFLGPVGTLYARTLNQAPGSPIRLADPIRLQPIPVAGTESANNNSFLTAAAGYTAATRDLVVNTEIVLPSGDYNFCRINMAGGGISAAPGAKVRIFVDAPNSVRPGSGCPQGGNWGTLQGGNFFNLGQPAGNPIDLQVFVVGWPSSGSYASSYGLNVVLAMNNMDANALIYAPQSLIRVLNNAKITGAMAGELISVANNFDFDWDGTLQFVTFDSSGFSRKGWKECRAKRTVATDPESGC